MAIVNDRKAELVIEVAGMLLQQIYGEHVDAGIPASAAQTTKQINDAVNVAFELVNAAIAKVG